MRIAAITASITPKVTRATRIITIFGLFINSFAIAQPTPSMTDRTYFSFYSVKEQELATQMMKQIRRSGILYPDPIVTDYARNLGNSLVNASANSKQPFYFFTLADDRVNAFAGPAGHIGINAGLILTCENESELASVLAHEIAHVTQGHLTQHIARADSVGLGHAATLLASIALGIVNPALGAGAFNVGMAGTAQAMLNFSRSHEFEADQIGIQLLYNAGYNPGSMVDFFQRLQQEERYYDRPPELLLTHPYTEERIAQSRHRLATMKAQPISNHLSFYLIQERIRNLMSQNTHKLLTYYQRTLTNGTYHNKTATQYGYSLALLSSNQTEKAKKTLEKLLQQYPDNSLFQTALGHAYYDLKQPEKSIALYQKAYQQHPDNVTLVSMYASILLDTKQAKQSISVLKKFMRDYPNNGKPYDLLSRAQAQAGDIVSAYQTRAKLFLSHGDKAAALAQLKAAQQQPTLSIDVREAIAAKISAIEKNGLT